MASIVVYDSGVGGLTVYREIVKQCPGHRIVFVSDNDAFPYGTKSEGDLINRVHQVVAQIAQHYLPDVLIIACNTASTIVLPSLRQTFAFDIVGVVPAIKPAAKESKTKHICLLATPGTVARPYTDSLIAEFASDCSVLKIGSTELVHLAEEKLMGESLDLSVITTIIRPVIDDHLIDVVVLACTHFPLLKQEIKRILIAENRDVLLVDSGSAVAQRVAAIIEEPDFSTAHNTPSNNVYDAVFTKDPNNIVLKKYLQELGFTGIHQLLV